MIRAESNDMRAHSFQLKIPPLQLLKGKKAFEFYFLFVRNEPFAPLHLKSSARRTWRDGNLSNEMAIESLNIGIVSGNLSESHSGTTVKTQAFFPDEEHARSSKGTPLSPTQRIQGSFGGHVP